MGERGPPRTPTKILGLRGSWLAKGRADEPQAPPAPLVAPDWLSPEAKAKWAEVAGILSAMGLLTIADVDVLAEYCHFWAKRERMTRFVAENGETHAVKDGKGDVKCLRPFPQAYLEIKYAERCSQLRKKLGLDPAARADMARETNDDEPKSRFFKTG